MVPLNQTIRLWMVGRGGRETNAKKMVKLFPHGTCELSSPVHGDLRRYAEAGNPSFEEPLTAGFGLDVGERLGLGPT